MALLHVNLFSDSLKRTIPIHVILPADKVGPNGLMPIPEKGCKTLYLLHGLFGNYTDWLYNTRVKQWAEERNLAVVMPAGDNSFYIDRPFPGNQYGQFVGQELVELTRRMFPLSRQREDTFIAGLSMGGYGAIRNGLVYAENFGCIAGFSSAVHILEQPPETPGRVIMSEDSVFGDFAEAAKSNKNPRVALLNLLREGRPIPNIYMSCGLQDSLLTANRTLRDYFTEKGVELTYVEKDGDHNWDFWNDQIRAILDWLPLDQANAGLSSGNVKV